MNEILEILEDDDSESLIYVNPPDDGCETEEDSDKSDDEHTGNLNNLGRKMLLSKAELQKVCNDDDNNGNDIVDENMPDSFNTTAATIGFSNIEHGDKIILHKNQPGFSGSSSCSTKRRKLVSSCSTHDTAAITTVAATNSVVVASRSSATAATTVGTSSNFGRITSSSINNTKDNDNNRNTVSSSYGSEFQKIPWKKVAPTFTMNTNCDPISPSAEVKNCSSKLDMFMLFFTPELLNHICVQSNLYASQKNLNLGLTLDELLVVIGGMLMSGYSKYPNKRMYWSREKDVPPLLAESIRCNRFEIILRHLHMNDNSKIDASDRLYKLRPFLDNLGESFKKHGGLDECLSIDESMIPYYGKHYAKQFIKGKPIRFGFKNWALCSSAGYMLSFDVYTGKDEIKKREFGLGGDVVLHLIKAAGVPPNKGHKIFFDNYFTSIKLLKHLSGMGICATGTIQENRTEKCPLRSKAVMKKETRGASDYRTCESVLLIRWNDNSVVTIGTNYDDLAMHSAGRWSGEKKCKIQVPQPKVFHSYNKHMGGVDQMDQYVATYRTRMRQKKWWWPIFSYFLDVTVVNAWLLFRKVNPQNSSEPLLNYRRSLALSLLKRHGSSPHQGKIAPLPSNDVRFDGKNHWPMENENQRRCANCTGKAKFICSKCNIGLHPKCFQSYHTQK